MRVHRKISGPHQGQLAWYRKAGVEETQDARQALYDFWVCNLTGWMYDNRGAGGDTQIPPYIVASVHQLRRKGGDG